MKKEPAQQSFIRNVVLSLKMKITVLVMIVLIFTTYLVVRFNIINQSAVLKQQQQQTMSGYLLPFKQNILKLYLNKKEQDFKTLQTYVRSFKDIPSFKMAMFVDTYGTILFHSDSRNIGLRVQSSSRTLFYTNYSEQIHSDFRIYEAEISTWTDKKGRKRAYTNDRPDSYDGFLPVYSDYDKHRWFGGITQYYNYFKEGNLFHTSKLNEEVLNNFRFSKAIADIYNRMYTDGKISETAKKLLEEKKLEETDLKRIEYYFTKVQAYQDQLYNLIISDKYFEGLMETLFKAGMPLKETADYIKWKEKKKLFSNKDLISPEQKRNLKFIVFLEQFIKQYYDKNEFTPSFEEFQTLVKEKNINVPAAYYKARINKLIKSLSSLEKYRTDLNVIPKDLLDSIFADMYGFYRLGTVRVILNLEDIEQQKRHVFNSTIDIAVMFILRMLVVVFLIVAFIIAPLNDLAAGTDEIAHGNLDKAIEIHTHDEIGQLADKFNYMTTSLKKAFDEVKDKTRMEEELRIAQEIQTAILPQSLPELDGYDFAVYYEPQTESGGDYYDFIPLDNDLFAIVVADVTNHGVGAAMVMSILRSALRTFSVRGKNAAQVIKDINPVLLRDTPANMFATVFYGVLNLETKEMFYSIAGHNQGIVFDAKSKKIRLMKAGGMPVGMLASEIFNPHIELYKSQLKSGEYFIQYSDGITEAKSASDEEYGEDRFYQSILKHVSEDLDEMKNNIIQDVKAFTAGASQSDDITLLIMKLH